MGTWCYTGTSCFWSGYAIKVCICTHTKKQQIKYVRYEKPHISLPYQSEKVISELELMRQNYHSANEEIKGLRMALEESRTNGDRLHKESELVVQNVNTWVQEQK